MTNCCACRVPKAGVYAFGRSNNTGANILSKSMNQTNMCLPIPKHMPHT
jgi:hypothetical protein